MSVFDWNNFVMKNVFYSLVLLVPLCWSQQLNFDTDCIPDDTTAVPNTLSNSIQTLLQFDALEESNATVPDPTLAVGVDFIVVTTNRQIAFYNKYDGSQICACNLYGSDGFFTDATKLVFDPKCFYDPSDGGHFFVVVLENIRDKQHKFIGRDILIAVSIDNDPNNQWNFFRVSSEFIYNHKSYYLDYPGFGFDDEAIYVSGNFETDRSGIRIFNKHKLIDNTFTSLDTRSVVINGTGIQIARCTGSSYCYFVAMPTDYNRGVLGESNSYSYNIQVHTIKHQLTFPKVVSANCVVVPLYYWPYNPFTWYADDPSRSFGLYLVGTLQNIGWRHGHLYCTHATFADAEFSRSVIRWYDILLGNWPDDDNLPMTVQSGEIRGSVDDSNRWWFYPAITANNEGDIGLVCGSSSKTDWPDIRVSVHKNNDMSGTMMLPSSVYQGNGGSPDGDNHWGDFYDIVVDPVDNNVFWAIGQYSMYNYSELRWKTCVTKFTY